MPNVENHKELVPFEHYAGLFGKLDPVEASQRCGVKYDAEKQTFTMRLLYVDYEITWPVFSIKSASPDGFALFNLPAQMLLIRYLLEGRRSVGSGEFLPYREMPWGEVYLKPFTGRCLNRAAFTFGTRLDDFRAAAAQLPAMSTLAREQAAASRTTRPLVSKVEGKRNRSARQYQARMRFRSRMGSEKQTTSVSPSFSA